MKKTQEYSTYENCYGLVAVNSKAFIIPGNEKGSLRIIVCLVSRNHLDAHDNTLRNIDLADEGSLLATVSERGTLIRVYNVNSGEKYQLLRRGVDKANISNLTSMPNSVFIPSISKDEKYVLCISDNELLHVFAVSESGAGPTV